MEDKTNQHECIQDERIGGMEEIQKAQNKKIDKLSLAMFGNKEENKLGVEDKVDVLYQKLIVEPKAVTKYITKLFIIVSSVSALIYTLLKINQEIKK